MNDKQKKYLAIGGAAIGGFLIYRHEQSKASNSSGSASPLAASNAANAAEGGLGNADTQSPVVLTSGESVYDPNDEGLVNTPGAVSTTTPALGMTLPQTVSAASPGYTINVNYPATATAKKVTKKATTRKVTKPTVKKKTAKKKKKTT